MEHAKEGAGMIGGNRDQGTGADVAVYLDFKSGRTYVETLIPSGYPPPSAYYCPTFFTVVAECVDPSPTGEQVTYNYWRCTATVTGQ